MCSAAFRLLRRDMPKRRNSAAITCTRVCENYSFDSWGGSLFVIKWRKGDTPLGEVIAPCRLISIWISRTRGISERNYLKIQSQPHAGTDNQTICSSAVEVILPLLILTIDHIRLLSDC